MTSWPDFGVPSSAESCLHIVGLVREAQNDAVQALGSQWKGHPRGPPIIVHCSAGIGRTGTFCTIEVNVARLADVGKCEVFNTVKTLRTQRALTIQTPEQYEFCHLAILEHALNMASTTQDEKEAITDFLGGWKMQRKNSSDTDWAQCTTQKIVIGIRLGLSDPWVLTKYSSLSLSLSLSLSVRDEW